MQRSAINRLRSLPAKKTSFVEPMECLSVPRLPEGAQWVWEIKLDGYRALAVKSGSDVTLFSRRRKSLNRQFPYIVEQLADLPGGTVVDGELVAIDDSGRPNFHLLQNFRAEASRIHYYIFDLLCCKDRDLIRLPLIERRELLKSLVMIHDNRIRISDYVVAGATELLAAVREQHLEGILGKRKDSPYQPGKRSGAWIKYRVNRGQELMIGGYTPGSYGIDAIIVGYHGDEGLTYVARIRNGFVPASRRQVFEKLRPLARIECPFVNLPETRQTRWGEALTAEKMKKCIWVNPELVAQIEFLEWTESDHLRHAKFSGLRDDKDPRSVIKEELARETCENRFVAMDTAWKRSLVQLYLLTEPSSWTSTLLTGPTNYSVTSTPCRQPKTPVVREIGAVRGVLGSVLSLIEGGATHVGVATDHVIESFRNDLYSGYKTGEGVDPALLSQFPILEEGLQSMGVLVWPMIEFEADDALASAAAKTAQDDRVRQVIICTPDKDLSQCVVGSRVVQLDRQRKTLRDEAGVFGKFGIKPSSIPDYLAVVGDSADGYPGISGWGSKTAAAVFSQYPHLEDIPKDWRHWDPILRRARPLAESLFAAWEDALLFRTLATLRVDVPVFSSIDDLLWRGAAEDFKQTCERMHAPDLFRRASARKASRTL